MLNMLEVDLINKDSKKQKFFDEREEYIEPFLKPENIENDFYNPISLEGNSYPDDYNPYAKEDWDDMIGD